MNICRIQECGLKYYGLGLCEKHYKRVKRTGTTDKTVPHGYRKHGMHGTKFYKTWRGMHDRCKDKSNPYYGGKGIRVCEDWHKFEGFYADMYSSYEKGLTIDRIDNSRGYEKGNCRWVSKAEQRKNLTTNTRVSFRGETKLLIEWSRLLGINYRTLRSRLFLYKMPPEIAFTAPIKRQVFITDRV